VSNPEPLISPPPALGPPIIGTDTPGSAPGVAQPVYKSGSATAPTAASFFPQAPAGTWMPPPQVGMGGNALFTTPVVPPGTGPSYTVPTYKTGSATSPTAASLFPSFTVPTYSPPIVFANTAQIGNTPPPQTTTTAPITISTTPIPGLPWTPGPHMMEFTMTEPPKPPPAPEPEPEPEPEEEEPRQPARHGRTPPRKGRH